MHRRLELLFSINVAGQKKSVIRELLKLTQKPDIISFAGGLPSPATFPKEEVADLVRDVVLADGEWALQYGPTEGDPRLKDEIVKILADDGVTTLPENIIVTSASQQALDLIAKVFLNRKNTVIVGRPSYVGAIGAFKSYAANFVGVDLDDNGMRMDILQDTLKKMRLNDALPKFIYVVPDFQNPAGVTMSLERRKQLLEIAKQYELLIVEDTPYRQLRYVGKSVPSLYELDAGAGYVVSIRTFSKILFPGIRLGWVMAPAEIIEKFVIAKQSMDLCTSSFNQAIAAEYCHRELLADHIVETIEIYRKKRKIMLEALETYMPEHPEICWTRPEGGLFLWLRVPQYMNVEEMFYQALEENVAYVIGTSFYTDGGGTDAMRLNFSYPSEEDIHLGVKRLATVIEKNLK